MMDDCTGAWESDRERTQEKRCTAVEKSMDKTVRSVEEMKKVRRKSGHGRTEGKVERAKG